MNLAPRSELELRALYGTAEVSYKQLVLMDKGYPPDFRHGTASKKVWELFMKNRYTFEDIIDMMDKEIRRLDGKEEARSRVVNMIRLIDRANDRTCLLVNDSPIFKPMPRRNNRLDTDIYERKKLGVLFTPI